MTTRDKAPGVLGSDRRELLLQAAVELFDQVPFEDVTVDAVAERAGVARGLVAYYFGNKAGLYHAVRAQFELTLRARLGENVHTDPLRWLIEDVQTFLQTMETHPMAMRNTTRSPYSSSPDGARMTSFTVSQVFRLLTPAEPSALLETVIASWGFHCVDLALRWLAEPALTRTDVAAVLVGELRAAVGAIAAAHPELDLSADFCL